ncbi:hypothetical protein MKW92_007127 [Papaver armeniacum]|nr:hypothetical protein MKW92_007127 [Papaver armeniacum]
MATALTDLLPSLTFRHRFPAKNLHQNSSTFLVFPKLSSNLHSSRLTKHNKHGFRFKCSIAKDSTISPSTVNKDGESNSYSVDCVIVGAGISGLCIAQALSTKHGEIASKVIVTEAQNRVGGNISTRERDGYLWEEGPNSFQPSDTMLSVAVDNGLKDELVLADPTAPRFVLWDGKLRPVPSKPADLPVFDLMSIKGSLEPDLDREESVEEFVRRNLGDEVFERLIEPFCSGVYAGDPAKLSMRAAFEKVWRLEQNGGSIIGGAFKALPKPKGQTVGSFKKGLAMLLLQFLKEIKCGGYNLTYETPEGLISVQAKVVLLADSLSKFYYPPVAAVSISYPFEAIKKERLIDGELKGFGQLHPHSRRNYIQFIPFPNRAPPGRVLLLNFIGGATNTGIVNKTEGEIVEAVDRDLRKMLITSNSKDPLVLGVRVWPQAIPQFLVGHLDTLRCKRGLQDGGLHGLFLGGNYVSVVALGRCVEGAFDSAAEVSKFLSEYSYK